MKILGLFILLAFFCLILPVHVHADSPSGTTSPWMSGQPYSAPAKSAWNRGWKPDENAVQGRIVYINRITGQIVVQDDDNVRRPVKLTAIQMKRMIVGESVDISLRDGGASAQSVRVLSSGRPSIYSPWSRY